jgi:uncharacterized RDD family membrane protein YckC
MILAPHDARFSAFLFDTLIILFAMFIVYAILEATDFSPDVASSLAKLLSFIVFNVYFIFFELAWRGRTPGKAMARIMVVNRRGGELTPTAIVARNLTRQLEYYIPLYFFFSVPAGMATGDYSWLLFVWVIGASFLPLVTRDRLRLGDTIGGTMVITRPEPTLLEDLSQAAPTAQGAFAFTPAQLDIYGYHELRILEDMLRRADGLPMPKGAPLSGLDLVAQKIKARIGYPDPIPPGHERQFITEFYAAQRGVLERELLHGLQKWNQHVGLITVSAAAAGQLPPTAHGYPPFPPGGPPR